MKNLVEITAIVREYLGDTSAVVTQPILDTVNNLSNIFSIDMIDSSQSTVIDEMSLDIPDESQEISSVFIDDEEITPLDKLDDLQRVKDKGVARWYEFGGEIQFTASFSTVAAAKIYYKKGFLEPTTSVATDVPQNLLELIYIGAQYRYYNFLLTQIVLNRDITPDIKPAELRRIRDDFKESYYDTIKFIKMNK